MSEMYQGQSEMESMFPGVSRERALELIKSMERLIPLGTRDRIWYLEVLIKYVDGLVNGDDIMQYTTSNMMSPLAKKSMEEILTEVHEKVLSSYRDERSELKSEVGELSKQKTLLEESIEHLLSRKEELFGQTTSLGEEVTRLNREYENLRNNRMAEIDEEVRKQRENVELEIARLKEEKSALSKSVGELKNLLNRYSLIVSETSKQKGKCEVTWVSVDENHPIYTTNAKTIGDFILSLKLEYMDNTGATQEECEREFSKYAPTLNAIFNSLEKLNFDVPKCSSINQMVKYFNTFTTVNQYSINQIIASLASLKLPKYKIIKNNIDSICVNERTMPTNVQSMMRELHFQRIALEAISKQKILEAELETVLGVLQSVLPEGYDLTSLNDKFKSLEGILGSDNKLTL